MYKAMHRSLWFILNPNSLEGEVGEVGEVPLMVETQIFMLSALHETEREKTRGCSDVNFTFALEKRDLPAGDGGERSLSSFCFSRRNLL